MGKLSASYSFTRSPETGKQNKLKLALTSVLRDELHSRVSTCAVFFNYFYSEIKTNKTLRHKSKPDKSTISCALPLTKGLSRNILKKKREAHSQKETMSVSLFLAFTLLSLCLHTSTSELLQFQLSTISAAPSFLPEGPSAPPLEAMSPDISPLFPTPGSSEMSPSPSESSEMPTIPSSLSPPNPDAVVRDPLLDTSPVGSPLPASSAVSLVSSQLSPLLVLPMLLLLLTFLQIL